jgi:hypothetical protein
LDSTRLYLFIPTRRRISAVGVQLHGAHLHRADQRFGAVDDHDRLAGECLVQSGNPRNCQSHGDLLEEQFTGNAIRRADQRHGPVLPFGQNPFGDAGVILRQQRGFEPMHTLGIKTGRRVDLRRFFRL